MVTRNDEFQLHVNDSEHFKAFLYELIRPVLVRLLQWTTTSALGVGRLSGGGAFEVVRAGEG